MNIFVFDIYPLSSIESLNFVLDKHLRDFLQIQIQNNNDKDTILYPL